MERYASTAKDLASRDVVSARITIEIRAGRGVGRDQDASSSTSTTSTPRSRHQRLPGISKGQDLRGRRRPEGADPVLPTVHYNMGGIRRTITARDPEGRQPRPRGAGPSWRSERRPACPFTARTGSGSNLSIDYVYGRRGGEALRRDPGAERQARWICEGRRGRSRASILPATRAAARRRRISALTCRGHDQLRGQPAMSCRRARPSSRYGAGRRHPHHRPLAHLEHGPDRDARVRQPDHARRWSRWNRRPTAPRVAAPTRARISPDRDDESG